MSLRNFIAEHLIDDPEWGPLNLDTLGRACAIVAWRDDPDTTILDIEEAVTGEHLPEDKRNAMLRAGLDAWRGGHHADAYAVVLYDAVWATVERTIDSLIPQVERELRAAEEAVAELPWAGND